MNEAMGRLQEHKSAGGTAIGSLFRRRAANRFVPWT
jgi:hypothetical protein